MSLRSFKGVVCSRLTGGSGLFASKLSLSPYIFTFKTMACNLYEKAVTALNGLQSNAAYLQKAREGRNQKPDKNLTDTIRHLQTLQITLQDVDSLNVIHVAGSKGKGSTCAFTESILRKHGYKTGFYSSPHLISVNERIRIDGSPISKEKFATYFWEVYDGIQQNLKENEIMPTYFLFLTVMGFYVFVKEQVKAAIIEVGIGGLFDCTNFVRKPVTVGITALELDHVNLLGSTITEIAFQKAGIFKPNVPAFTVPQPENAMNVLRTRAQSVGCSLALSPPLETYEGKILLGVKGVVQNINASLALQLSHCWLTNMKYKEKALLNGHDKSVIKKLTNGEIYTPLLMANTFLPSSETKEGIEKCEWPGRYQIVQKKNITFYLDGAHTAESIKYCKKWFKELSQKQSAKHKSPILKILLFNCTGDRKAENLLDPLVDANFDISMFCPNKINVIKDKSSDLSNFMVDSEQEMQQCITNKETWSHLIRSIYENQLSRACNGTNSTVSSHNDRSHDAIRGDCNNIVVFPSITDSLNFVSSAEFNGYYKDNQKVIELAELIKQAGHIQVLVTGSLHLVGGVISIIQQ